MAVGRISGPLLKANLLRNGVDLAFETDLLYLDVTHSRIGIRTNAPTHDLHVNGTTRTETLEVTNQLDIGNVTVSGTTISTTSPQLTLTATGGLDPVVYQKKIVVDDLDIVNNSISINSLNTDLELAANGTGLVKLLSNTLVNGDLHATGTITADGDITIGDSNTDNISFNADIASNILPNQSIFYTLGDTNKRWNETWTNIVNAETVNVSDTLTVSGLNLGLRPGNTFYVSINGSDAKSGTHQSDPFRTVKHALSVATSGTTVYVYPGVYEEIFPLTIPAGVTLKGGGLRSVTIQPTVGTISNDAILLSGDTTVEDLSITGFRFNSVGNTGYAFKFAPNFNVTTRSPYIRNVTVITSGSITTQSDPRGFNAGNAGKGAYLDGSVALSTSKEASLLCHGVTFITPGVDCITAKNGVRIEWLNSFTYFANRGIYGTSDTIGFAGQGKTEVRLDGVTGTFSAGQTLTYYSTYPTVLATGTISSVSSDGKIFLTGKVLGLQTAAERGGKTIQTFGNAKLSQSIKKFGTASLALDGTGDYAFVQSNSDFAFGTNDFAIEMWIYRQSSGTYTTLVDMRTSNPDNAVYLGLDASNRLYFGVNGGIDIQGTTPVTLNTWTHVALTRNSGTLRIFLNGTQTGSSYSDSTNYAAKPLYLGADYTGAYGFNGHIDDVRISKGVGRYNGTFTPPISILPNDSYTVLLSRFDGADNSTTFVDETYLIQDIRSNGGATATKVTLVDYSDFGVEVRSIGSASIYGNYGAVGDGLGVVMYLIGQNMAYVGTGYRVDNDPTYVIQENEVVELNGAKVFYSSVDHKGDFRVGDLFYVNQENGTVTFTSAFFDITSESGLTFTNGSNVTYIDGNEIDTGNLKLSGNTIESLTGDFNVLSASDQINLLNNVTVSGNLDVVGNVTIGGNIVIGDQASDTINFVAGINSSLIPNANNFYDIGSSSYNWKDLYANRALVGNISITSNQIITTASNTDLVLNANGSGAVVLEGFVVQNNEIRSTSNNDIVLAPNGTGMVDINSTKSVKVPVGTDEQRPLTPEAGMIRFNTTTNRFEGFNGTSWVILDGISDLDGNTKITAELTPGANDNTIRFYADGTQVVDITPTRMNATVVTVDDIQINGTTISNTAGGNLTFLTSGLGSVILENFTINGSSVTNTVSGAVTTFNPTGGGYFKVGGTGGMVVPSGLSTERPAFPVLGMIRYDTQIGRLEVYEGTEWVSAAGSQSGITRTEAENIAFEGAVILG